MTKPLPRLLRRAQFLRVAGRGRKAAASGLVLQALAEPPEGQPCGIGFTTSRKVGNAVARNRARRRLRAAADAVLRQAPPVGWSLVVIGRTETLTRPFPALVEDLRSALRRTGVAPGAPPTPRTAP